MINQLILKNFTTFNQKGITVNFSPKINVIIGENGTGKTHLLKAAYSLCAGAPLFKNKPDTTEDDLQTALTTKLVRVLMPLDEKLGKLHHQGATEQTYLQAQFDRDQKITATFFNNSKAIAIQNRKNYEQYQAEAVYIPTKEVLSFMKGFNSLYEKYGLSFDQTYQDICLLLDLPQMRAENLHKKSKWAMDEIKRICGGSFIFYGGGNVTFKTENAEFSANAMAEGFRKMGMLSRLLETGAIRPGISGPLFWDEPESNMNPKLMKLLVEILLELSRNGQQIILATHDYVLLKWFDLLIDKNKDDVSFHALFRDEAGNVKVDTVKDYRSITPNVIADTFNDLTKEQVNKKMGGLGK
jgi:AAA15 family ATPase/GTPase